MPDQPRPKYLAGLALERGGNFAGAITQYQSAAKLEPNNFDISLHWGVCLLRADRGEDAEKQLRQAIALRPDSEPAHSALVDSLIRQKKTDSAIKELHATLVRNGGDVQARLKLATTLYELGKPAEALAELDRADANAAPSADRAKLRASILISQKDWGGAAKSLAMAVGRSAGRCPPARGIWQDFIAATRLSRRRTRIAARARARRKSN